MKFPRWAFTSPGATHLPGGSYGSMLVESEQEYEAALAAGYSPTVDEAMRAKPPEPVAESKSEAVTERAAPSPEPLSPEPDPEQPRRGKPPKRR